MLYVVVVSNNEGGQPATLHRTLDEAKTWIRAYLRDGDPPLDDEEKIDTERDLANLTGECTESVKGSEAWKEWVYVAPVEGLGTVKTDDGLFHFTIDAGGLRATKIDSC